MYLILLIILCSVVSAIAVSVAAYLMHAINIVDRPDDGHKLHNFNTPFVGGVGVLAALCLAFAVIIFFYSAGLTQKYLAFGVCSIIIFLTGFIDETIRLSYKLRFIIQAVVALIMVLIGGVVLNDLGGLLGGQPLQLVGWLAIAFTIFAVIGGINAINMIDGIDGLAGSISLVSLLLVGIVAVIAGDQHNAILITALAGGVVGFLYHNLRYASKRYARVFLGDNGSMLLGFIFAWLLVDLSQGSNPAMTPVTAIWLFSIPLMDTIGVMLRRLWLGQSPFMPDHYHLHHLCMKAGFFVTDITLFITLLHMLLGAIGLTGLYLGIPEFTMLLGFLLVFLGYFYLTLRPLWFVLWLRHLRVLFRTRLGFAHIANSGAFLGNYSAKEIENLAKIVNEALGFDMNSSVRVFEQSSARHNSEKCYAITLNAWPTKDDYASEEKLKQYIALLQQRLKEQWGIQLRQFVARKKDLDWSDYGSSSAFDEFQKMSRRSLGTQALTFEVTREL